MIRFLPLILLTFTMPAFAEDPSPEKVPATEAPAAKPPEAAATDDLFPAKIPARIVYKRPAEADARSARDQLAKEFQQGADLPWSGAPLAICTRTWARIKKLGLIKPELGIQMTGISPDGKKGESRAYREEEQVGQVWKFLRERLRSKDETRIRTPDAKEMDAYWALIGWDLENTPLFIVEHGGERFLFAFSKDKPSQVVDFGNPSAKPAEEAAPEKPGE